MVEWSLCPLFVCTYILKERYVFISSNQSFPFSLNIFWKFLYLSAIDVWKASLPPPHISSMFLNVLLPLFAIPPPLSPPQFVPSNRLLLVRFPVNSCFLLSLLYNKPFFFRLPSFYPETRKVMLAKYCTDEEKNLVIAVLLL